MINPSDLATQIFAALIVSLLSALTMFLWKLPQTLKELQGFMRSMNHKMELMEKRLEVHDDLWSQHFNMVVRSDMIALGNDDFPRGQKQS